MRILAITKRVLLELVRDKRTLALIFIAPILIMWLMNVMFSANTDVDVTLGTVNVSHSLQKTLDKTKGVSIKRYANNTAAEKQLKNQKIDGIISYHKNKYNVTYANTDSSKTLLTKQALNAALTQKSVSNLTGNLKRLNAVVIKLENTLQQVNPNFKMRPIKAKKVAKPTIQNHYKYGDSSTNFFAKIIPILMGFFIFFFVFLISGMGLLNERNSGTLDRLLATPVKRSEIIFGYMLSYGVLAIAQSIVIVLATIWLLKIEVVGSIFSIILICLLFALVALSFGILASTLAESEFQMMQFIPIIVLPQVFFSGIIPLSSMATWVQYIGKILPLTYAGNALTQIVMNGTSIMQLGNDILALFIFLIILVTLNIIGLKRYRKV